MGKNKSINFSIPKFPYFDYFQNNTKAHSAIKGVCEILELYAKLKFSRLPFKMIFATYFPLFLYHYKARKVK